MDRQIARLRLLGILFCLLGGVAITLGWTGTARVACVDCQVPYLLSGGAAGIALTVVGTGLLVIAQLRVEGRRIADRVAELADVTGAPPGSAAVRDRDPATGTAPAVRDASGTAPTVRDPGGAVPVEREAAGAALSAREPAGASPADGGAVRPLELSGGPLDESADTAPLPRVDQHPPRRS